MSIPIKELDQLLFEVSQVFDGWHSDGTAWSDYDESIRKRVSEFRKAYTYNKNKTSPEAFAYARDHVTIKAYNK